MSYGILITSAGGRLAPAMIDSLKNSRRHDVRVVACDAQDIGHYAGLSDSFRIVPLAEDTAYVDTLLQYAKEQNVQCVLPCADEEVVALSGHHERFAAEGITVFAPDGECLAILTDKAETYRKLESAGYPTPTWKLAETADEIEAAVREMVSDLGECVVKPIRGRGGRGVFIIHDDVEGVQTMDDALDKHLSSQTFLTEFLEEAATFLPVMVMERLGGPGWDIDILCRDGEVMRVVPRRRMIPSGTPFKGCYLEKDKAMVDLAHEMTRFFNLTGLLDFDIMSSRKGEPHFTEINPRPSGGVVACAAAGMPILDDVISLLNGETLPPVTFPEGAIVLPYMTVGVVAGP